MVLAVRIHLEMVIIITLNNPEQPILMQSFPKIHSLRKSLVLPYTLVSLVVDFTQMLLTVRKHLEVVIVIILNNPKQPILI